MRAEVGVFDHYAVWYNAFNKDKDYAAETHYIVDQIKPWCAAPKRWLDIGCGTGKHLACLHAESIVVEGLDSSPTMIAQARLALPQISFHIGSAQDFHLPGQWDVISMLFHVMSYQTTDALIEQAMQRVAAHLGAHGVFVFDFWHTEGVLRDPPGFRVRETLIGDRRLYRISRPSEDQDRHRVDIRYEFRWDAPDGPCVHEEHHSMRHFRVEELTLFLRQAGLALLSYKGWMHERAPGPDDWYGLMCARRR